jgi:tight adherence protein B
MQTVFSVAIFSAAAAAVLVAWRQLVALLRRQELYFDVVLRGSLLLNVRPRVATILSAVGAVLLAALLYALSGSHIGAILGLALGLALPYLLVRALRRRRLVRLESQLVGGIQSLTSGVRAGLNLVQSMQLIAREGPAPIRQEFAHLLQEYEYGLPLDEAMRNAAERIGSTDYRLLFAALATHRQRGGNLGQTLDRIAESIREIQRLENRVQTLTAQGRATARWLGALPLVVMGIMYLIVDAESVRRMLADDLGKVIISIIVLLNIVGFVWIRKIVSVDI